MVTTIIVIVNVVVIHLSKEERAATDAQLYKSRSQLCFTVPTIRNGNKNSLVFYWLSEREIIIGKWYSHVISWHKKDNYQRKISEFFVNF